MNKWMLVLFAVLALSVAATVKFKFSGSSSTHASGTNQAPVNPAGTAPDDDAAVRANRDTYVNTVTTIASKVDSQAAEINDLKALLAKKTNSGSVTPDSSEVSALKQQVTQLEASVAQYINAAKDKVSPPTAPVMGLNPPVDSPKPATAPAQAPQNSSGINTGHGGTEGLGLSEFDHLAHTNTEAPRTRFNDSQKPGLLGGTDSSSDGYVTLVSLDTSVKTALKTASHDGAGLFSSGVDNTAAAGGSLIKSASSAAGTNADGSQKHPLIPVYTLEDQLTLMDNTNLTSIFGNVPEKGQVEHPYRFKIISGSDNLASNGLSMPYIKNIVWSGYAYGNREMKCVSANLDKVTYTFQDNTIRTYYKGGTKSNGQSNKMEIGLGYLSDRQGNPCIPGIFISNATQYLRDRMAVAGATAAADAAAASQTTTTTSPLQTTTTVTNKSAFIANEMSVGTLKELAAYLKDRMDNAIDIVVLKPGFNLTVHVEEEIPIDYDPQGRKLIHASASDFNKAAARRLD